MTKLKILQANTNRSVAAQDLAKALGEKMSYSFLCMQEPNRRSVSSGAANLYVSSVPDRNAAIIKNKGSTIPLLAYTARESFVFIQTRSICLYSVYISPNCTRDAFQLNIDELFAHARATTATLRLPVVICGDFNAKNSLWGGTVTDYRGEILLSAAAALGLSALNDGAHPTLVRTNGHSFVDLTLVSQELVGASWRVLHDEESLSDHLFVLTEIDAKNTEVTITPTVMKADAPTFIKNLRKVAEEFWGTDVDNDILKKQFLEELSLLVGRRRS